MSFFIIAIIAAVVSLIFGWLWHGPILGKPYGKALGMPASGPSEEQKKFMKKSMPWYLLINFAMSFLMAMVVYLIFSFVGMLGATKGSIFILAAILFVGFSLPLVTITTIWNGRSPKSQAVTWGISMSYHLINLALWSLIFFWLG
jgi:hypothetical protein